MRVLVTGDREWVNYNLMEAALVAIDPQVLIHGAARGADTLAGQWGESVLGHENVLDFPAEWDKYHKSAGPIRNQQMLNQGKPDVVVAFHENYEHSKGTKDMVDRAFSAGLPIMFITRKTNVIWNATGPFLERLLAAQVELSRYQSQLA